MKVVCATSDLAQPFYKWFDDIAVLGHEDRVTDDIDLLILTGGSDVSPSRYNSLPGGSYGIDLERDEREFNIVGKVMSLNPRVKILAVCRGLQLLNVLFGGNLIQDLSNAGIGHSGVHTIDWLSEHPLSWLTTVNSMHHQAVSRIDGDNRFPPYILAIEPNTRVPEVVSWGNAFLGVQFHPEFFSEAIGERFFAVVKNWVDGLVSLGYPVTAEDLDGRPSITWSNDTDYEEDSFDDDEDEELEEELLENVPSTAPSINLVVNREMTNRILYSFNSLTAATNGTDLNYTDSNDNGGS